jgi:hypothetical protein
MTMSRKLILALATAATVAVASLSTGAAEARGFGGGGFGGGMGGGHAFAGGRGFGGGIGRATFARLPGGGGRGCCVTIGHPIPSGHPIPFPRRPWVFNHHDHHHWVFRFGHWIVVDDVVEEAPVDTVVTGPGPCTCLTKSYTPSGLVVFADVCTKESASAPVNENAADASQAPTSPVAATAVPMTVVPTNPNYAGKTYDDYLAANPQAANQAPQGAQKN